MKSDLDLKNLWSQQTTNSPNVDDFHKHYHQFRKKNTLKLLVFNLIMIATFSILLSIWIHFEFRFLTTKFGLILILLSIVLYMSKYTQFLTGFRNINENQSNSEFLSKIIKMKKQQKVLQSNILQTYFILLTLGISLYIFEYVSLMSMPWSILVYMMTFIWLAYNWFFVRPQIIRKEGNKMDKMIQKYQDISQQN